jgi:methionine-S-sulfoxide reductase
MGLTLLATLWSAGAAAVPDYAGQVSKPAGSGQAVAVVAGGCFWGVDAVFKHVKGVSRVVSGYAGGSATTARYMVVSTGATGHAESVEITYDPAQISYPELLKVFFTVAHDPTQLNRQGPDHGTQYRSAIFVTSPAQRKIAEEAKARAAKSGRWKNPVVTEIVDAGTWTPAESYHQDYLQKNPGGYTCHYMRD